MDLWFTVLHVLKDSVAGIASWVLGRPRQQTEDTVMFKGHELMKQKADAIIPSLSVLPVLY